MRRLPTCAVLAALLVIGAIIGLVAAVWSISGSGDLPDRQKTMDALVSTNEGIKTEEVLTLTAAAVLNAPTPADPLAQTQTAAPPNTPAPLAASGMSCADIPLLVGNNQEFPVDDQRQVVYALLVLFQYKQPYDGKLYNPLSKASLTVGGVSIEAGGRATITLHGQFVPSTDPCDSLYAVKQIEQTALKIRSVSSVSILINDVPYGAPTPTPSPTPSPTGTPEPLAASDMSCADIPLLVGNKGNQPVDAGRQIVYALLPLLAYKDLYDGKLYNPLGKSSLTVSDAVVDASGHATIALHGQFVSSSDPCDNVYAKKQIEQTALAITGVSSVSILINDVPIEKILSGQAAP